MKIAAVKHSPSAYSPNQSARFGLQTAPWLLQNWDFQNFGLSNLSHSKMVYVMLIASRTGKSRSWNEAREHFCRDSLGAYSWFMGNPFMQIALATFVVPNLLPAARPLLISKIPVDEQPFLSRFFKGLFNPYSIWHIASDGQLKQRKMQIVEAMKAQGKSYAQIKNIEQLFEKTCSLRSLMSFIGIIFTIAVLGVGIPLLNIAITRSNVRKKLINTLPKQTISQQKQQAFEKPYVPGDQHFTFTTA